MSEAQKLADKAMKHLLKLEKAIDGLHDIANDEGDAMQKSIMADIRKDAKQLHKTLWYGCRIGGLNEGGAGK